MGKLDELKEKSSNRREAFRVVALLLVASLTGTVASGYSVFVGMVSPKALFATAIGCFATVFLSLVIRKFWIELEQIEEDIKDV
jgi:hypothetical protein